MDRPLTLRQRLALEKGERNDIRCGSIFIS